MLITVFSNLNNAFFNFGFKNFLVSLNFVRMDGSLEKSYIHLLPQPSTTPPSSMKCSELLYRLQFRIYLLDLVLFKHSLFTKGISFMIELFSTSKASANKGSRDLVNSSICSWLKFTAFALFYSIIFSYCQNSTHIFVLMKKFITQ